MFPVCGEDRGTTTTPVVVLVVDTVDSPSSNFEKFLRNFQNCEDGSTRSTPRKKVEEYLVLFYTTERIIFLLEDLSWPSLSGVVALSVDPPLTYLQKLSRESTTTPGYSQPPIFV